ncbi:MAG: hypothetical protein H7238_03500 [Polaromonas sp.]|nr:hypothetical protein [Polaromonas sp.]
MPSTHVADARRLTKVVKHSKDIRSTLYPSTDFAKSCGLLQYRDSMATARQYPGSRQAAGAAA